MELYQKQLLLMNHIKEVGKKMEKLIDDLSCKPGHETEKTPDQRWTAIAKTHFQQGFMAIIRAIEKPETWV